MSFKVPSALDVSKSFPELQGITFIQQGGFKAVYSATASAQKQALKLVFFPSVANPENEEEVLLQKEVKSRVRREIELLSKLRCPEIVKLGVIRTREVGHVYAPATASAAFR